MERDLKHSRSFSFMLESLHWHFPDLQKPQDMMQLQIFLAVPHLIRTLWLMHILLAMSSSSCLMCTFTSLVKAVWSSWTAKRRAPWRIAYGRVQGRECCPEAKQWRCISGPARLTQIFQDCKLVERKNNLSGQYLQTVLQETYWSAPVRQTCLKQQLQLANNWLNL